MQRDTRLVNIKGVPMVIYQSPECISDDIVKYNNFWEFELYQKWSLNFPTHGLMLDLGANIGSHCLQFAKNSPNLEILAFELHHENFKLLKINTQLFKNIKCYNIGIGSTTSMITYNDGHEQNAGVVKLDENGLNDNIVLALDDLRFDKTINFIKIDIEGHELSAFEGMRKTLLKHKPKIWLEDIHGNAVPYLQDLGYSIIKSEPITFDYLMKF